MLRGRMTREKWSTVLGLCACLGSGCSGGGSSLVQSGLDDPWPSADVQGTASRIPTGPLSALTGFDGQTPGSSGKTASIGAGLGTSLGRTADVYHVEGVFKSTGKAALSAYIEYIPNAGDSGSWGSGYDYDLTLLSAGLEIGSAGGLAVEGSFLRLGLIIAMIDLNEPDAEVESDQVTWFEVRGGYRFCFGKFVVAPQARLAFGRPFIMRDVGSTGTDESRPGDVGLMVTMGVLF